MYNGNITNIMFAFLCLHILITALEKLRFRKIKEKLHINRWRIITQIFL